MSSTRYPKESTASSVSQANLEGLQQSGLGNGSKAYRQDLLSSSSDTDVGMTRSTGPITCGTKRRCARMRRCSGELRQAVMELVP